MSKLKFVWLLLALVLVPFSASAQSSVTISQMEVDLWPEYDQPSMLVIYRFLLAPETTLPASLTLRIPASVGNPYSVAVREADGMLYNLAYTRTVDGNSALINFTTTGAEVQFEYYDARLIDAGGARSYTFQWPGDYPVTAMTIQVQVPVDATGMQLQPSLGNGVQGEGGLTYYNASVGSVPLGQTFAIMLNYQKTTDRLSAEALKVQPVTPVNNQATGWLPWKTVLLAILAVVGVGLVVGGVVIFLRGNRPSAPAARHRRRRPSEGEHTSAAGPAPESATYCQQCGKRAAEGDRFCRTCGAKLRTPD